jgi:hypothetical protein
LNKRIPSLFDWALTINGHTIIASRAAIRKTNILVLMESPPSKA